MGKIGIIGHFGGSKEFLDGQTVKTKILYQELKNIGQDMFCVDTYYNNTNRVKLLLDSLKCILKCKTIIILLSGNGMRIYFPMMYLAKKLFGRKIFHDVIGGNLAEYVDKYPEYKKYLNSFDGNWVEFEQLKKKLEHQKITNCKVIPNFKKLNIFAAHLTIDEATMHKLCMFSRVMREKGITDAIQAVHYHNKKSDFKFFLEIWGPVDDRYEDEFEDLIKKYPLDFKYMGKVNYSLSVETLTDHLALLFPTFWEGEGFPGTIVDAYAAGLPVIASKWNANAELIDDFKTGWVYPNSHCKDLASSLEWMSMHSNELIEMRRNAHQKAIEYIPEKWIDVILNEIT